MNRDFMLSSACVLITVYIAGGATAHAAQGVIHVPKDLPTIQQAIDAAEDGSEIVVAPGTYFELIDLQNKSIALTGANGPIETIIHGNGAGPVVRSTADKSASSRITGFTIAGGFAQQGGAGIHINGASTVITNCIIRDHNAGTGGGAWIEGDCAPEFTDCVFLSNSAGFGAGVAIESPAAPTFLRCTFEDNIGVDGGAIYLTGAAPRILDCLFLNNEANQGGAILITNAAVPIITGSTFQSNIAGDGGAILSVNESDFVITNCSFIDNQAGNCAGAIYAGFGPATITNCIFSRNHAIIGGAIWSTMNGKRIAACSFSANSAALSGGALHSTDGGPYLSSCILWNNLPDQIFEGFGGVVAVEFCDVQDGWPGVRNIDKDPLFVNAANDNLRIIGASPCRDAAAANSLPPDLADLDGDGDIFEPVPYDHENNLRVIGIDLDMGAYEWTEPTCPADFDSSGDVGFDDFTLLLASWGDCSEPGGCAADLDGDVDVDFDDFTALLAAWGPCDG